MSGYRKRYEPLTDTQKQVIFGSFLGDGYLGKKTESGDYFVTFEHSKKQLEYVQWKSKLLCNINGSIDERSRFDKRTNRIYHFVRCRSKTHPEITAIRKSFYSDGKKEIKRKMLNMLTPLGLAVWFMDDGSATRKVYFNKSSNKQCTACNATLSLGNISERESKTVKKYFKVMLGIDTKYYKYRTQNCFILRFNATEFKKLVLIIAPYIIPSMRYKIEIWKNPDFTIPPYNITPL